MSDPTENLDPEAIPTESLNPQGPAIDQTQISQFDPDAFLGNAKAAEAQQLGEKYGTPGQLLLTGLEGAAYGFAGPVQPLLEKGLTALGVHGLEPQEQANRAKANPYLHAGADVAGLAGGIMTGTGEAAVMAKAGDIAAHAIPLAGRITSAALRGAVETATYQTSDEVSKAINDPTLGVSSALGNIALSALIGGGAGGAFGAISPLWSKTTGPKVEQAITDMNGTMRGSISDKAATAPLDTIVDSNVTGRLQKLKGEAPAIIEAAERNNWPVLEGMVSGSKEIQMAEDSLLNGNTPTLAGTTRRKAYEEANSAVRGAVDAATAPPDEIMTETQAGNALKQSLGAKLEAENAPIKNLYSELEPYQQAIPLTDRSTGSLSRNISKIIEEKGLVKGTARYNYVKSMSDGIGEIDNLQKLKNFRTEARKSAGPECRDLAEDINDRLNGVEERAIQRYSQTMKSQVAKDKITGLLDTAQQAKNQYRIFRGKMQELGNVMGKKKIYGPQDFIDFVSEMNPQAVAKKLFSESNTEFAGWFAKEFPEEFQIMRGYQRGLIRTNATTNGVFNPTVAVKAIIDEKHGLEPEMQKLLFNEQELATVKDAKLYTDNFPKSFNPSGTAHESAFRSFFESPTGAAIGNARDFAIQAFIKAMGPQVAKKEASQMLPLLAKSVGGKEVNAGAFKHATDYAVSAIRGENAMGRAAKSVFQATIPVAASLRPEKEDVKALDEKLKHIQKNPDAVAGVGGNLGHYLPNHDISMKGMVANAAQYLNGIRPSVTKAAPLDPEIQPSEYLKNKFNRALEIAEKPLSLISSVKDGTITDEDVNHLMGMYPAFHQNLSQKLMNELTSHVSSGNSVPYQTRVGLSRLLRHPMDSSLSPQNIQSNQAIISANTQQQQGMQQAVQKRNTVSGMKDMKVANRYDLHDKSD